MKLYIAAGVYAGTQAEAKKLDRDFEPVEVPTDKEGLIAFLNARAVGAEDQKVEPDFADEDISDLLGEDEPATAPVTAPPALTPHKVIDWLLDTATPPQVEGVFTALGARFHEATKGKNND